MHLVERLRGVEVRLGAHEYRHYNAHRLLPDVLFVSPRQNKHDRKADQRNKHGQHLLVVVAVVGEVSVKEHCKRYRERRRKSPSAHLVQLVERLRAQNDQQEADHERVAVREPVRHLTAVPHHIHRANVHAQHHHADEHRRGDTLPGGEAAACEVQYHAHQSEGPGVEDRHALHADGVVFRREQLDENIRNVEILGKGVIRVGKREFSVGKRLVHRKYHEAGHQNAAHRACAVHQHRAADLPEALVCALSGGKVPYEVQRREDTDHIADIEICSEDVDQRQHVKQELPFIADTLYAHSHQRKRDQTVQPHGVHGLHDEVAAQRPHHRKAHRSSPAAAAVPSEEQRTGKPRRARLCEHHRHQTLGYPLPREDPDQEVERACEVVPDYAHELTGKVSAPAIPYAFVPGEHVVHVVVVVNVLRVQVEGQHGARPERPHLEYDVRPEQDNHRQQKRQPVRPAVKDGFSDVRENVSDRRQGAVNFHCRSPFLRQSVRLYISGAALSPRRFWRGSIR